MALGASLLGVLVTTLVWRDQIFFSKTIVFPPGHNGYSVSPMGVHGLHHQFRPDHAHLMHSACCCARRFSRLDGFAYPIFANPRCSFALKAILERWGPISPSSAIGVKLRIPFAVLGTVLCLTIACWATLISHWSGERERVISAAVDMNDQLSVAFGEYVTRTLHAADAITELGE